MDTTRFDFGNFSCAENQLLISYIYIFGKLLKEILLKSDQLKLRFYKLHESEIVIVVLSDASYKLFNIMKQEL